MINTCLLNQSLFSSHYHTKQTRGAVQHLILTIYFHPYCCMDVSLGCVMDCGTEGQHGLLHALPSFVATGGDG